jgi:hypothetical protein
MTRRIVFSLLGGVVLVVGCKQPAVSHAPYAPVQTPCAGPACGNAPVQLGQMAPAPANVPRVAWGTPAPPPTTASQGMQLPPQWHSVPQASFAQQASQHATQFPSSLPPAAATAPYAVLPGQPLPATMTQVGAGNHGGIHVAPAPGPAAASSVPIYSPVGAPAATASPVPQSPSMPDSLPAYQPYGG